MGTRVTTYEYTYSVGTLDLAAFCGEDCPDCAECCGVSTPCCGNSIPKTLFCTFQQTGPSCTATVITLTWNALTLQWEGSGTVQCGLHCTNSFTIALQLSCGPGNTWLLVGSCDGFVNQNSYNQSDANCSPFQVTFADTPPPTNCGSCTGNVCNATVTQ